MRRERALRVVLVLLGLLFCAAVYPLILMVKQDPAVAMMMSDIGRTERAPSIGATAKLEPATSRPVITTSSRLNATISRSRNHPSDAIR